MRISPGARDWFLTQSATRLPPHLHQRLASSYTHHRAMPTPYVRQVTDHIHMRAAHHGMPRWEEYVLSVNERPGTAHSIPRR
ncbi:hypothetical protein ABT084_18790 [Streptomyces sp. NPDC002138]|uniref:hypothetical protein n=1 Tax=Streptomyces sp. NPDC002138 TaxID=3154410 RepID=UPI003331C6B3